MCSSSNSIFWRNPGEFWWNSGEILEGRVNNRKPATNTQLSLAAWCEHGIGCMHLISEMPNSPRRTLTDGNNDPNRPQRVQSRVPDNSIQYHWDWVSPDNSIEYHSDHTMHLILSWCHKLSRHRARNRACVAYHESGKDKGGPSKGGFLNDIWFSWIIYYSYTRTIIFITQI